MQITLRQANSFCQKGQRVSQEDARWPDSDMPGGNVFVVCDGVGGNVCGEIASRLVCDTIGQEMQTYTMSDSFGRMQFGGVLGTVYDAIQTNATEDNRQMATTLAFVAFHKDGCFVAHIGDSRVYQLRPGCGVVFQTEDHSLANELVRCGELAPDKVATFAGNNVITRSVTADAAERAAASTININDLQAGDYFLLCTDGVVHCVSDAVLERIILAEDCTDEQKCGQLASLCQASSDNNTAILVAVEDVVLDENDDVATNQTMSDTVFQEEEVTGRVETRPLSHVSIYNKVQEVEPDIRQSRMERLKMKIYSWFIG